MDSKYVITITRQFGSLGRPIAKKMSAALGVNFYDRDIIRETAKVLNYPYDKIRDSEESARRLIGNPFAFMARPLGGGTTETQDSIYNEQKRIIEYLADKESCIIVGRCADFILEDHPNAIHIFIYAPYKDRLEHCIKDLGMEEEEAKKMIIEVDRARDAYHMNYAGYLPGDKLHYQLMIDSSLLGVDGTAEYLIDIIKRKFGDIG